MDFLFLANLVYGDKFPTQTAVEVIHPFRRCKLYLRRHKDQLKILDQFKMLDQPKMLDQLKMLDQPKILDQLKMLDSHKSKLSLHNPLGNLLSCTKTMSFQLAAAWARQMRVIATMPRVPKLATVLVVGMLLRNRAELEFRRNASRVRL